MAINSSTRSAGPFAGAGGAVVAPFTFKVFQTSDLLVIKTDSAGAQTTLVLSTDYTVSLNGDQDVSPGGTVTVASVASGYSITLTSNIPATQPATLTDGGGFFPKVIEAALDRLTILFQQLNFSGVLQTLRVPETGGVPTLPAVSARASKLLSFDSLGNPTAVAPASGSAAALATDLTSSTDSSKGAGQVGFGYSLGYAAGTLGKWLKDLALSTGAGFIGWIHTATGAVLRSVGDVFLDRVFIMDFLTTAQRTDVRARTAESNLGAALDCTAAMQAAFNTGKVVRFPDCAIKFDKVTGIVSGGIIGEGQTATKLISSNASTDDLLAFIGGSPGGPGNCPTFRDFSVVVAPGQKSAGAAISIAPSGSENTYASFFNVNTVYTPIGADVVAASLYAMVGCNFLGFTLAGVQHQDVYSNDAGDSSITASIFSTPYHAGTNSGILQKSSGGLRVTSCKFLGGVYSYFLSYTPTTAAASSCSIAGTVLTVGGSVTGSPWAVGQTVNGAGVAAGLTITSPGTGTGGAGTYNLSSAPGAIGPIAMTGTDKAHTPTSNLIFCGNSCELYYTAGMYFEQHGNTTFKSVIVNACEFGVMQGTNAVGIATDNPATAWLSSLTATACTFDMMAPAGNITAIALTKVSHAVIGNNIFKFNGGAAPYAVVLDTCDDVTIAPNTYAGITTNPFSITNSTRVKISKTTVAGTSPTSASPAGAGWAAYGALFLSPASGTVLFKDVYGNAITFLAAPAIPDVVLSVSASNGEVAGVVQSVSTTGFTFRTVGAINNQANTIFNYSVQGLM